MFWTFYLQLETYICESLRLIYWTQHKVLHVGCENNFSMVVYLLLLMMPMSTATVQLGWICANKMICPLILNLNFCLKKQTYFRTAVRLSFHQMWGNNAVVTQTTKRSVSGLIHILMELYQLKWSQSKSDPFFIVLYCVLLSLLVLQLLTFMNFKL